ncbi:PREDICTED: U-box domain-containing protein 35-like isoform X2 [Populus euphratica]|nr:PREDICTED: U-box domain-containing protein 35-like isoform X2 [Populus euphratica]
MIMMEQSEIIEEEHVLGLPPSPPLTVGIAIDGKRSSKYLVLWALEKFMPQGKVAFKLLHVCPKITAVPTPMGNFIPISQVRDDVAAAYKKEKEWQTLQMLLPFKSICTRKKVQVDIVLIELDDVAKAIAEEVARCNINKLVIGAASHRMFTRKHKGNNLSSRISVCAPNTCTVYAVSKGKLLSIRPSDLETSGSFRDGGSITSRTTNSSSSSNSSSQTGSNSVSPFSHFQSPSLPVQRFQALSSINHGFLYTRTNSCETNPSRSLSLDFEEKVIGSSCPSISEIEHPVTQSSSFKSLSTDHPSWRSDQAPTSDVLTDCSSFDSQANINFELEKLRIELRHARGIYAVAQSETLDASRKLNDLTKHRLEEATRLQEIKHKEEKARELARQERGRCEVAIRKAECLRECAKREASQRNEAEIKAMHDAKEKEKLEKAIAGSVQQYQEITWEEIVSGTLSFSEELKIGMGAYGTVYKCNLHHTTTAVKVLHSKEDKNSKQFQQELEILSKIHHPHLLMLLGACPDHGCLVYEYMKNGSLEDRLQRVNNTPPIPWFERYRIAWEIASALVFLHSSKPKPIIHRDLKPANILLDHNFVSKIGDVGLSTMLCSDVSSLSTMYKNTGPVGTLCYIDPEYQRNGVISPKSDAYAFGMIILQLLTAKPAIALAHVMETAMEEGHLVEILDSEAGNWPLEETKELATLGLSCTEIRQKDRPDLKDVVLPALERLNEVARRARDSVSSLQLTPPKHLICPILKDLMDDPCVAADGYTYNRKAIQKWLEENDKSPMTNLPLPNKDLLPSYTLLSAIMEWKSKTQSDTLHIHSSG